jgi:hypothetical protein
VDGLVNEDSDSLVRRAFDAFRGDTSTPPPLTLRGGYAVDGYDLPEPFDVRLDEAIDSYIEGFAFWGLAHLDAQSWRHYLPRLIEYALGHRDDPAMVAEALVRSLRPPDRYPSRLGSLTSEQEVVVREFLELLALADVVAGVQDDAQQALEEWWLPNPRSRPSLEAVAAMRAEPVAWKTVGDGGYRLTIPLGFSGSGARDIPSESRRVEVWGGFLCWDVHTVVAVNVTPVSVRTFDDFIRYRAALFDPPVVPVEAQVPGSPRAVRLDGRTPGSSPAEPQALSLLIADLGDEVAMLSVKSWPRDDVLSEVNRIVSSFEILLRRTAARST